MESPAGHEWKVFGEAGAQQRMAEDHGVAIAGIDVNEVESLPGDQGTIDHIGREQLVQQPGSSLGHQRTCRQHVEIRSVEPGQVDVDQRSQ